MDLKKGEYYLIKDAKQLGKKEIIGKYTGVGLLFGTEAFTTRVSKWGNDPESDHETYNLEINKTTSLVHIPKSKIVKIKEIEVPGFKFKSDTAKIARLMKDVNVGKYRKSYKGTWHFAIKKGG